MPKQPPSYSAPDAEAGALTFYRSSAGPIRVTKGFDCVDTAGKAVSDELDRSMSQLVTAGIITADEREALIGTGPTPVLITPGLLRRVNTGMRTLAGVAP